MVNLRIDDRLATALRNSMDGGQQRMAGLWQQLVDLLAQNPRFFSEHQVVSGLVRVRELLDEVDLADRVAGIETLSGRIRSAPLVRLLAADEPPVAAAAIAAAQLSDDEWAELVPALPVRARGFLRLRDDLGRKTRNALRLWSAGDFTLPGPDADTQQQEDIAVAKDAVWQHGSIPIGEVVERIEQWRRDRENSEAPQLPFVEEIDAIPFEPVDEIRFETDDNGTITWVEGAPRGAIVGIDIAEAAFDNGPGPDAYGAAAFRQRMPMDSARMRLRGASAVEGEWRMTAAPFFDANSGRFRGFRGIMRRPSFTETAAPSFDAIRQGEQIQQVIHELRTPLGAIAGFAEIIEQQLFGPVSREYRELANAIMADAGQLLAGFDDLTVAAKLSRGERDGEDGATDCAWLAARLAQKMRPVSDSLNVTVNLVLADPVRPFAIDKELAERILSRLLGAVILGCVPGEQLNGRFSTELGTVISNRFALSLPARLRELDEGQLLGASHPAPDLAEDSPLLGLGFSLRLVRNLARNVGGDLHFQKDQLVLTIPAVQDGTYQYKDFRSD